MALWLYRAGTKDEFLDIVTQFGWLVLGFFGTPDFSQINRRSELRQILDAVYPETAPGTVTKYAKEIGHFLWSMQPDDHILLPFRSGKEFLVGRVLPDPYRFVADLPIRANHVRSAEWLTRFPREQLPGELRSIVRERVTLKPIESTLIAQLPSTDERSPAHAGTLFSDNEPSANEGAVRLVEARLLSRDRRIVEHVWQTNIASYGGVGHCLGCGFEHPDRGMFDIHHMRPVAQGVRVSRPQDLIVLCPRCHRLAHHRRGPNPLSIAQVRKIHGLA